MNGLDGGQGEAARVPQADGTLIKLPVGIDDPLVPSVMSLSDVLPTGHHAAVTAGVGKGSTVAVIGDGAVGLSAVLSAARLGAERIAPRSAASATAGRSAASASRNTRRRASTSTSSCATSSLPAASPRPGSTFPNCSTPPSLWMTSRGFPRDERPHGSQGFGPALAPVRICIPGRRRWTVT